ncbi:MAG: Adenylosuccinate lyase [Myxococcaceae bacterium]|nr:Adenylosuccinate lyase [Myxococcaceae bacterium]MEA2750657.1 adenylosuccinate lyase [Myxococcales bacterium]
MVFVGFVIALPSYAKNAVLMIPRYTPSDLAALWSSERRYQVWLEVELAACDAMEEAGVVPKGTANRIRAKGLVLDAARIEEIERTTKHDVIAFLTHVEELAGDDARWLHRGMTSSDVLDTSFAILLRDATDGLVKRTTALLEALAARAREHAKTPMIGRSHGIFAEPVTFGLALAGHHAELARGRERLVRARETIAVGKIAGAVGTYAHLSPSIEQRALAALGLRAETVSTQVVARDRHAELFCAMALVAAGIERFATNVRHWQRSEVGEAEEAFTLGQKGSSAMPHKRNPILSENLCGLARVVRAACIPALENVALWHERDISHSSAERMIAPDTTATLAFMLDRARGLVEGLVVYPDRLKENLGRAAELYFSEAVLLALVESGMARQEAYVLVQRNAMRAWRGDGAFRDNLAADADVSSRLTKQTLDQLFDLDHALQHVPGIVDRALGGVIAS